MENSSYFSSLIERGNPASIVSLVIWAIFGVIVLAGVLFGLKRGFSRTVVRLATIVVSAVASFFIASNLDGAILGLMRDMAPIDMWDALVEKVPALSGAMSDEMRSLIASFDAETAEHLVAIFVSLVIIPITFAVIFYVLKLVTLIIYWVLSAMLGMTRKRTKLTSRLLGAAVGLLQGGVIAAVVLLPFAGLSTVAAECRTVLTAEGVGEEQEQSVDEFYMWWIDDAIENPVLSTLASSGGNALYESMTTMEFEGAKVSTEDELVTFIRIANEAYHLAGASWDKPTEANKQTIDNIVDLIGKDYYTATVISGLLRGLSTAVETEALVINVEEPMASFLDSIIGVFLDSSKDNLHGDMETILHIYYILGDNDVLVNFYEDDALRDSLIAPHEDGKNVIDYVVEELYANPRTVPIVNTLMEISVKIMCEELNVSDDAKEIYENVKTGVNDILKLNQVDYETEEEYKEAVSTELSSTLEENNITVDQEIIDSMSDYIVDNYSDVDEITDEDVTKAILSYYQSYAQQNPDGSLPDELPDELPDDLPEDLEDILGGLI